MYQADQPVPGRSHNACCLGSATATTQAYWISEAVSWTPDVGIDAKYRMQTSSCLYPMSLEAACTVAERIKLRPECTYIEPSRFSGVLFDNVSAATLFRLAFDAKHWPTNDDDLFLLYIERSPEVSTWIASTTYEFRNVEIVAILFGSEFDQKDFEAAIWPGR